MIRQAERYTTAMEGTLKSLKMGDKAHAEVTGPQLCMFKDQNGRPAFDMGYVAMVVLDHNRLINQEPIAVLVCVRGMLPVVKAFESATGPLLEECRRLRDQANNPQPSADENLAVIKDAERDAEVAFRKQLPAVGASEPIRPTTVRKPRERESHFGG